MFHIPGSLLEYARAGSALTYQNVSDEFDKLLRQCLLPDYLEPIEQAISDQLPRATAARFNTDALLRADVKTRFEVYQIAVTAGIMTVEEARAKEGLGSGDIETAPVPPSPPQAYPTTTPTLSMRDIRCRTCSRLLGRAEGAAELRCSHCKTVQLSAVA
jgi:LSD1 subclass zinc finger protein